MIELNTIYNEDCLDGMKRIPDASIDCIICDLPYGVLNKGNESAQWDNIIPFKPMWEQYERIIKDNGAIILFAQGMFTADLMTSNRKMWRYNLIWKKGNRSSGFLNANKMPLRNHEDIVVFYKKTPTYNPQMVYGEKSHHRSGGQSITNRCYGDIKVLPTVYSNEKFPISIIDVEKEHVTGSFYHPTQKPVNLIGYLIKTYTNEGETILDNCIGSGTTAVACMRTNRNFIGFELKREYYEIAMKRIKEEQSQYKLDL